MRPNKRTSLLHLIYFSRLNLSAEVAVRNREIEDIARHAQKKNEFSVITSFLMVDQNFAVQILEGERTSLTETFNRIVRDSRHRDVHIVEWREIAKRGFVHSFTTSVRGAASESVFAKANLMPSFQRGTPKASAILALAQQLQSESMTKQGIEHLFV
jgi:hypothetical protein